MKKNIIEIHQIEQLLHHIDETTHVFFDIDNTLLMPIHEFGSEYWENFLIKHFISEGIPAEMAINRASHLWRAVQAVSEIKLVEAEKTASVFNHVKNQQLPHFAITARSFDFSHVTKEQLISLDLHFPKKEEHQFQLPTPSQFDAGVFYCGDTPKAHVLQSYIEKESPKRIIMIDDNLHHLSKAVELLSIEFIGLRYAHLDHEKTRYTLDPISKVLFKVFNHPLACKYLKNGLREENGF